MSGERPSSGAAIFEFTGGQAFLFPFLSPALLRPKTSALRHKKLRRYSQGSTGTYSSTLGFCLHACVCLRTRGQLLLQLIEPPEEVGQLLQRDHLALGLAVRLRRGPQPFLAVRDVVHDAG